MRLLILLATAVLMRAAEVPAGTVLHIRILSGIGTVASKPGDKVQAAVIAPVEVAGTVLVPSGATLSGVVRKVIPAAPPEQQSLLAIEFRSLQIGGSSQRIMARLTEIDNARESVDTGGNILGIDPRNTLTSRLEQGFDKLGKLGQLFENAKGYLFQDADPNISFGPGVEMEIQITKAFSVKPPALPTPSTLEVFPNEQNLPAMVSAQPFITYAQHPYKPSDLTNLILIGSQPLVERVFADAGWSPAVRLTNTSRLETARAILEQRGYRQAPVSIILLDERQPDLVFQKGNDTFASRHHIRLWRSADTFQGQPVWNCAATHDIGIDVIERELTFIHKIDPNIDLERDKIVNDLLFTGEIRALDYLDRPSAPRNSKNATGDSFYTDGKVAIMMIR